MSALEGDVCYVCVFLDILLSVCVIRYLGRIVARLPERSSDEMNTVFFVCIRRLPIYGYFPPIS